MLQNTSKTLGFQKIMVYKTPPGGGGKPYLARGLTCIYKSLLINLNHIHVCVCLRLISKLSGETTLLFSFLSLFFLIGINCERKG